MRYHKFIFQNREKNLSVFRTLNYPPIEDENIDSDIERCGQHTDYGTMTLLFQDDIGGLEVSFKLLFFLGFLF